MIPLTQAIAGTFLLWILHQWYAFETMKRKLSAIPTIGSSNFILGYFHSLRFAFNGHELVAEGYKKYPGGLFKLRTPATTSGWIIVGSGTEIVEDIRRGSSDHLSFFAAMSDSHGSRWVGGIRDGSNDSPTEPYHFDVVRLSLTRSFPSRFDDICDEISASVGDMFGHSSAWNGVPLVRSLVPVIARTTNRLFIGLPLCRDREFLSGTQRFTSGRVATANVLQLVPGALKPLVGKLISPVATALRELEPILGPIIRERLHQDAVQGAERADRPKDLISWLLDFSPPEKRNVEDIIFRIISLNFVSVHTTSITIANALFDLAAHPKYLAPLRAEAEGAVEQYGWTKEAMNKMRGLDSFLKESSRMRGTGSTSMTRKVLRDFTLSNGITLPAGSVVGIASRGLHHDSEKYEDPLKFDGFRFLRLREKEEGGELKYQMVSLHHDYLLFGHGRSACPGRFFAVNEAKAVMAHILLNYDIKFPEGVTSHPAGKWFSASYTPHPSAQLLVRKRV
ncbi:cytochrome P450 [Coprinellus micaceus]|uniref:Cytochrome P450 n=1 Tax=Coprinellus micaceus TaxID=71717 RepID=A0A4Y7TI43_COPMI|nr:cytochrome P450 [Coprinellus micaceus]